MESSPLFDLNEAIGRWRERLIGLRSFGADDLEELENHLRESAAELQAGGLSLEEAFLVATDRLGSDQRLAEEYAKTNARRIWTGRAVWMVGGVVAWKVMKALVETGLGFVYNLSMWLGLDARLVVTLDLLVQWTITAACIGLAYWLIARRNRWMVGAVSKCFQRPVWTGLALVLGLMGLQVLSRLEALWWQQHLHRAATLATADHATLNTWGFSAVVLNRLACIAAIPLLAAYLWKTTRTATSSIPALPIDSLQPNERALAGQLEAQGLSRSESHLVIASRRGYRPAPAEAEARLVSRIWLERGLWMLVGMVANWMLRDVVDMPSWMVMHLDRSSPLVWQHVAGLMETCLPLALVGAMIAVFWKGATGTQKRNGWMHRIFKQSPVRGATLFATLAILWAGLTAYLSLVHPPDMASRILSYSRIETIWWVGRSFVTQYLLPAMLLVWIGHQYQTGRKSA